MHEFEAVENAILGRLEALKEIGLKTLDTYSGQMDVEALDDLTLQFPCCYVVASDLSSEEINRYRHYGMGVSIIVGDRNVRGSRSAARGDASSPGVYELLLGVRGRLAGVRVLDGWTPLKLMREEPLVYAPRESLCVYSAYYELKSVKPA